MGIRNRNLSIFQPEEVKLVWTVEMANESSLEESNKKEEKKMGNMKCQGARARTFIILNSEL